MTEPNQIPNQLPVASGPEKGSLLVHGGGSFDDEFKELFRRLAGGDDAIVAYVPTAAADDDLDGNYKKKLDRAAVSDLLGVNSVSIVHTRDRQKADSKHFAEVLEHATGVFIDGGRQWRLVDSYLNTRTQTEIENVLQRGGVVAGSSAGATIQGSLLIRGNAVPDDNTKMLGDHQEGFGLLKNVVIDQHLVVARRTLDLLDVLAEYPTVLGIGVDEDTFIWVQQNEFEVLGSSCVIVYDLLSSSDIGPMGPRLLAGSKYDLGKRKVIRQVV
ncbi:MAG: cyanophycinase [Dehalococcoidia bacterium]